MAKKILFGEEARSKVKKGIDQVANAVKVSFGPKAAMSFWIRATARRSSPTTA